MSANVRMAMQLSVIVASLVAALVWTNIQSPENSPIGKPPMPRRAGPESKRETRSPSLQRPTSRTVSPAMAGGFENQGSLAAGAGIEEVKRQLHEIHESADREAFLRGAFEVAAGSTVSEALDWAWHLEAGHPQDTALMTLLSEWSGVTFVQWMAKPDFGTHGIAATLGEYLLRNHKAAPAEIAAFAHNFVTGPAKPRLLGQAAAKLVSSDPEAAVAMGDGLLGADAYIFEEQLLQSRFERDPQGTMRWVEQPGNGLRPGALRGMLMAHLMRIDAASAAAYLSQIPADANARPEFAREIGANWAMKDTRAALTWAESLPDPQEREDALEGLHRSAPIGIGAAMDGDTIRMVLPDSPAQRAGLQSGDRILGLTDAAGEWIESAGMSPAELIETIRGPAQSRVTLRLQTPSGETRDVEVTREQSIFKE